MQILPRQNGKETMFCMTLKPVGSVKMDAWWLFFLLAFSFQFKNELSLTGKMFVTVTVEFMVSLLKKAKIRRMARIVPSYRIRQNLTCPLFRFSFSSISFFFSDKCKRVYYWPLKEQTYYDFICCWHLVLLEVSRFTMNEECETFHYRFLSFWKLRTIEWH